MSTSQSVNSTTGQQHGGSTGNPPPPPPQGDSNRESSSGASVTQDPTRVYNSPVFQEQPATPGSFQHKQDIINQAVKNDLDRLGDSVRGNSATLNTRLNQAFSYMEKNIPSQIDASARLTRSELQGGLSRLERLIEELAKQQGIQATQPTSKQDAKEATEKVTQNAKETLDKKEKKKDKKSQKKSEKYQIPGFQIYKSSKGTLKFKKVYDNGSDKSSSAEQRSSDNASSGDIKAKLGNEDSDSNSEGSSSGSSSDSDESMHTVDMPDYQAIQTKVKPKTLPNQVISTPDVQPLQRGQDLHAYMQIFENSYCGSLDDRDKIYKLINKVVLVQDIKDFALSKAHYNSWVHFRNKLLKRFGKKQETVLQEFRKIRKERDEDLLSYVDKLISKLQEPAADLREAQILNLLWMKLPWQDQDEITLFGTRRVKTVRQFRHKIENLVNSPLRQKVDEIYKTQKTLNDEINRGRAPRRPEESKRDNRPRGRSSENRGGTSDHQSAKTNQQGKTSQQGKSYIASLEEGNIETDGEDQNQDSSDFETYFYDYTGEPNLVQNKEDFKVLATKDNFSPKDRVEKKRAQEKSKLGRINEETLDENQAPDSFNTSNNQSYPSFEGNTRSSSSANNPGFSNDQHANDQSTSGNTASNSANNPGFMDSEYTTPQQPQDSSTFRTFADRQLPKNQLDEQIKQLRKQQLGNRNFLIDSDTFFDRNGCYDLSLAEDAISQVITFKQLRQWKDLQQKGHTIIYHALAEQNNQSLEYLEQVQEQSIIQSDLLRINGKGEHLLIKVQIEDVQVQAIIDTGAQKTLVSRNFVNQIGLQGKERIYKFPSSLTGISGGTQVSSYLQEVTIRFPGLSVMINPPIIQGSQFDMLLGQDILLKSLVNCSIHFKELVLRYQVDKGGCLSQQEVPLSIMPKSVHKNIFSATLDYSPSELFPGIEQIQKKYDLILIDPPFEQPGFFGSKIPYPTLSQEQLGSLEYTFAQVTKGDSILLFWTSGRYLQQSLELIRTWGFEFVNILLVWIKVDKNHQPKLGLGYWTRNNVEMLLLAKRGKVAKLRANSRNIGQIVYTVEDTPEVRLHSSKPLKAYEVLEKIFKLHELECLEFFARVKGSQIQRQFFDLYGNEIPGFFKSKEEEIDITTFFSQSQEQTPSPMPFIPKDDLPLFWDFINALDMPQELKLDRKVLEVLAQYFPVFDCKGQVGRIQNTELRVHVRPGAQIPHSNLIRYDKERSDFIEATVQEWLDKGYVERGPVKGAYPIVVVNKKGPKKYRACINFQPLNEVLIKDPELEIYKGDTAEEIIYNGQQAKVICTLDCKEAHNALPVPESDREWLGILTPQGTMRSKVGQFGINPVAKVYIKAMTLSIGWLREHGVYFYADDIILFGRSMEHCLWLLAQVLRCLLRDGFIVSAKKCNLFQESAEILGQVVGQGEVRIAQSKIESIRDISVPKTKKELQRFIGCLTYLRKFLPNLASLLVPLYDALKGPEILNLSGVQTGVFESLKTLLTSSTVLRLPEKEKPFYITIVFNKVGYGAALLQKDSKTLRPVFYRSKTLHGRVVKPWAVQMMRALLQACKEWHPVLYNQEVRVLTDNPLLKKAMSFKGDDPEVNELLLKLWVYKLKVEVKPEKFRALRLSQVLLEDHTNRAQEQLEELLEQHLELQVQEPQVSKLKSIHEVHLESYQYNLFFDGACTRTKCSIPIGTYGVVVLGSNGQVVYEESGRVISEDKATNNLAESYAALQAVKYLKMQNPGKFTSIQILGDSELVVRQLKGQYRVNSDALRSLQREIKGLLKPYKKAILRNIPRELNEKANFLAQEQLKKEIKKELEISALVVHQPDELEDLFCILCGKKGQDEDLLICDNCGSGQHRQCLGELLHPTGSAFYCKDCEHYIFVERLQDQDITQDHVFLGYLENPGIKLLDKERSRCQQLAKHYSLRQGDLFFHDKRGIKRVPSLSDRHLVTIQIHQALGHCGKASTVRSVRLHYFWPGMTGDIGRLVESCHFCQAKKQQFLPMPQVWPTSKGMRPFQYVSVDLIEVRSNEEEKYILTVVCAYSKWPELTVLTSKRTSVITEAFMDSVVCRYGPPLVVRSDEGAEFQGEFKEYLQQNGIHHVTLGPRYPQGNGLVERINQIIKQKLQSLNNSEEFRDRWQYLVQMIAFSIRISQSRATKFSPYQILFGRDPLLPGHFTGLQHDTFFEPSIQQVTATLEQLRAIHTRQGQSIQKNLDSMNQEIKETIEAREFKALTNLQFGQALFVRNKDVSTKLDLQVEGPCYFLRYLDPNRRDMIVFYNPRTRRYLTANISNVKLCL